MCDDDNDDDGDEGGADGNGCNDGVDDDGGGGGVIIIILNICVNLPILFFFCYFWSPLIFLFSDTNCQIWFLVCFFLFFCLLVW